MADRAEGAGLARHDPEAADRYAAAREALSTIPLAVVLIGAADTSGRGCATGTAMYVSFSPPRVAIALHPGSRTTALVRASGRFSISVLDETQVDVAMRAGRGGGAPDKFAELGVEVALDAAGTPAFRDALAAVWCTLVEERIVGDHVLFVGEVEAWDRTRLDAADSAPALVRHRRRYASIGAWRSDEAPEGYPT